MKKKLLFTTRAKALVSAHKRIEAKKDFKKFLANKNDIVRLEKEDKRLILKNVGINL